jgi:hypothetical protein
MVAMFGGYAAPLDPPLSEEDHTWAEALARATLRREAR